MSKLFRQALGHDEEPLWMAMLGMVCLVAGVAVFVLGAVALGFKP